jgi:plasmid stabilization system protein ParE
MSLPTVLRAEAQADFDEAFDWYEAQRPGLGTEFAAEVQKVFDRISATTPLGPFSCRGDPEALDS